MIKIYGASDDLIEIEGDIREEFEAYKYDKEEKPAILAVSDGTLLKMWYDDDGIWRISRLVAGTAVFEKIEGDVEKDTPDIVTLTAETPIKWVVVGEQRAVYEPS
jgi:hypothetical protein